MLSKWIINTDNSWDHLDRPFTTNDISNTIKQINPNKAPGPDGITNLFYINHSSTISPILAQILNNALNILEITDPSQPLTLTSKSYQKPSTPGFYPFYVKSSTITKKDLYLTNSSLTTLLRLMKPS
ncbi:hypothetical protein ACTFIZ_009948 [Dictyostelium cf. discoideum]